jgi:hypothetical protein
MAMTRLTDTQIEDQEREAHFWANWTEADEAQFQADMGRIVQAAQLQLAQARRPAQHEEGS